jgi:ketosteroid isomerase-like protein
VPDEHVEIARAAIEAWSSGGVEAVVEHLTPDCVFYPDPDWMEEPVYRGRDAVTAFLKSQTDTFGDFAVHVHEVRAVGDSVLVLVEIVGRAAGSGVPIRQPMAHVASDFREGMIGRDRTFLSWSGGLKAVGLEE